MTCSDPESARLAELHRFQILDTPPEEPFDDAVALVRTICDTPIALVSLVDEHRQWFKARSGVDVCETARDTSVCSLAIRQTGLFIIGDLSADPRTAHMPLVRDDPHLRFYAGAPLIASSGAALGSLCAIDLAPRPEGLTGLQQSALAALGRQVARLLEARLSQSQREEALATVTRTERHYRHIIDSALDSAIIATDQDGLVQSWSRGAQNLLGWTEDEMRGQSLARIFIPEDRARGCPGRELEVACRTGRASDERWHLRKDGSRFYAHGAVTPLRGDDRRGFVKSLRDITRDHEAKTELLESREELELATRAARLGRFDYWPGKDKLRWDDRCRELFGLPAGAVVSYESAFLAGLHPEDRDKANAAVLTALAPGGDHAFETEYRTIGIEDGIERHVAAQGMAFFEGDVPIRLVGTVRDVTLSRAMRRQLEETEHRLRLAVRATNDAIWDWDLVANDVRWNDSLERAYGHDLDSIDPIGEWWLDHIHPEDRGRIYDSIHAVIDGDATDWIDEYRFRRADGSYADVRDRGYVLRDDDGAAIRMIGAMLDQSDMRARLRQSEARADDLADVVQVRTIERDRLWEATNDLMGTAGLDGYLKELNPAWERLLCWTNAELLGEPFPAIIHPDDQAETKKIIERLSSGEHVHNVVNRVRDRQGHYRTIMWDAVPQGRLFHIVGRDLTEQHIAEERLRQSQKMEAVGQLTGGIAHDFNNMLTGVIGSLDILKRDLAEGRTDRIARYMDAANTSAQRAAGLTHRLLAFSRRQSLDVQSVDLNRLVCGMEDLLRRTIPENVTLEMRLDAEAWPARTDSNQLESALLNLAINARDAMAQGGSLAIETGNSQLDARYAAQVGDGLMPGDYAFLSVSDNGGGMSTDTISKAFEPFFTTKPIGQGTGLGLSMIYGFARQSGGHVRISSVLGEGTTVRIYLPRADAVLRADVAPAAALAGAGQDECIMVVEDDPAVRMLVVDLLGSLGYGIIEAADGRAAIPLLEETRRLDLLITDVGLPGLNGRQVAEIARQTHPDLPVLFVTGYAEQAAVRGGFLERGMDMIAKPFAIDALAARVREMIEGARAVAGEGAAEP